MWHALAAIAQKAPPDATPIVFVFVGILVVVVGFVLVRSNKKSSQIEAERLRLIRPTSKQKT